ncbi:MAG: hypothetical protein EZS28_008618 [Streblomastix strix]|uniref:Uncharacterized protein n=1 Tax=Streblomastix strix TaxID=222440 RepID=A0A5J4WLB0_9EUKA|nr:MAG: hypothetical protein EZS28_008618 [Streblomastix strix]
MITFILLISFITKDFAHYEINSIQLEREILHVQQGDLISNILLQVDPEINHNWEIKIDPGIYAESQLHLENSSFDEISRQEGLGNAIDIQVNKDTTEQQEKHWKSAVNIRYGKLNLINSQFVGCIGGALSIHSSNVEIDSDTTFSDNYSGRDGYNSEMRNIICQGEGSSISATSESFIDSFAKGNQKSYFIIADTYCILSQEFSNITSVNVVPIISSAESEELEGFNQVRFDIQGQRFISNDTQDLDTLLPGSRIAEVSFSLYGFEFHPVIDNESMEIITGTLNYNQNNSSDTAIHIQSSNEVIQTHIIPEKIYWENDSSVIFDLPTQMFVNLSGGFWELRLLYGHNGCTPWVTIFNNTYSTTDTKNKKDAVLIISIIFAVIGLLALFYLTIFLYFYCFKWKPLNTQTPEQRMQLEHSRSLIMEPYKSGDNLAKLVKEVKDDNNDDEFSYKNQTNIQEIQESRSPITPEYKNGSQFSRGSSPKSVITIKSPTMTPSASFNYLEKFMPQNSSRFGSLRNANKVMVVQQGGETQNLFQQIRRSLIYCDNIGENR